MKILTRMKELAKTLSEYPVVRAMGDAGDVLVPKQIVEIGGVRRILSGAKASLFIPVQVIQKYAFVPYKQ